MCKFVRGTSERRFCATALLKRREKERERKKKRKKEEISEGGSVARHQVDREYRGYGCL